MVVMRLELAPHKHWRRQLHSCLFYFFYFHFSDNGKGLSRCSTLSLNLQSTCTRPELLTSRDYSEIWLLRSLCASRVLRTAILAGQHSKKKNGLPRLPILCEGFIRMLFSVILSSGFLHGNYILLSQL